MKKAQKSSEKKEEIKKQMDMMVAVYLPKRMERGPEDGSAPSRVATVVRRV